MPYTDITPLFNSLIHKRRNAASAPRVPAPPPHAQNPGLATTKMYLAEAYNIVSPELVLFASDLTAAQLQLNLINNMSRTLASIRRAYLNVDSSQHSVPRHVPVNPNSSLDPTSDDDWAAVKHLTNEQRDQIDLQSRILFSRCADSVKEMEALEKRRAAAVTHKDNPLLRFLPARLLPKDISTVSNDFIAAHHASITWYLNRRLAEASQSQKEMQEERIRRQLDRAKTLGSGAARDAVALGMDTSARLHRERAAVADAPQPPPSPAHSWIHGSGATSLASSLASLTRSSSSHLASSAETARPLANSAATPPADEFDDEELAGSDADLELSASQILQFENENASILRSVQDTLASVQLAESRLLDISALQMELVAHLTQQSEITDQLHEDAIATTETVYAGNEQLREARRRQHDSRIFVLIFLLGASFSLLFLHYY